MIKSNNNWLKDFFNTPNDIRFSDNSLISESGKYNNVRTEANNWLSFYNLKNKLQILVPLIDKEKTYWYACSIDKTNTKRIKNEVESFVNAYTIVNDIELSSHNIYEQKLISYFGENNIIKIIPNIKFEKEILDSITQYRKVLEKKPYRQKTLIRDFSLMRSDFEKSLSANNKFEAERCLEEMRRTGRLDLTNQIFLEIQLQARLGEWENILTNPYLTTLFDLPIPKQTLVDIIEAVYTNYLYQYELNNDYENILKVFNEKIIIEYGKLLKSRKGIKNPSSLKLFFIKEIVKNDIDFEYCENLLNEYPVSDKKGLEFLKSLFKFKKPKVKEVKPVEGNQEQNEYQLKYEKAIDEMDLENFDTAFQLLINLNPDEKVIQKILLCFERINSSECSNYTWNYFKNVPTLMTENLKPNSARIFRGLKDSMVSYQKKLPENLHEVIEYYLQNKNESKVRNLIENNYLEWSQEYYISNKQNMDDLINNLDTLASNNISFYKEVLLPKIIDTFFQKFQPNENLKSLAYSICLNHFLDFESFNRNDLDIFRDLCSYALENGVSNQQYNDMIYVLKEILKKSSSSQNLPWILDITDIICSFSFNEQTKNSASGLFSGVICPFLEQNKHRIDDWFTIEQLSKDFSIYYNYVKDIIPIHEETEIKNSDILNNKIVAIYTLTDQAAYRAQKKIEDTYPGVIVKINNDKDGTEILKNLAKTADIFIFCWKSSKHQAYFSIKSNIKDKANMIHPDGKGSDSIVRKLNEHILQH